MAIPKTVVAQRDFSAGQLDPWLKRGDDTPIYKSGARQVVNWRILNSRGVTNRPGRIAVFLDGPRTDKVLMAPNSEFYLVFGPNYLRVYNQLGAIVFDTGAVMPWSAAQAKDVVWAQYQESIYITFGGAMRPKVLTWDGASQISTWSIVDYVEQVIGGTQKRTIFYRIAPKGITLQPSARSGNIAIEFSADFLTPLHVGTRLRFVNQQMTIIGVTDARHGTATVNQTLLQAYALSNSAPPVDMRNYFQVGDVVIGQISGAQGIVTGYSGGFDAVNVQSINSHSFGEVGAEVVVGPNGSLGIVIVVGINPQAIAVWDEEIINDLHGYPASCFVDQGRLGFCNFRSVPGIVSWSAIGIFTDIYTDASNAEPANAIVEIVPGKSQVLFVIAGMESSEFVICDNAIYYIPISATNPLRPGSVAFNQLTSDGAAQVQPRALQQTIVYVAVGGTTIKAIQAPGAYGRPYIVDDISQLHRNLITDPIAIAAQTASDQYDETYIFVLNADATISVGKYTIKAGLLDGPVGWVPWSGVGTPTWVGGIGGEVIVTGAYAPNGITPVQVVERLVSDRYLDAAIEVNNIPVALAPPVGLGPLWWLAGGTVNLMDQSTRMMGTYDIDDQGYIVPQFNAGEDLTAVGLIAGQPWTATLESFVPAPQPGQDVMQRMTRRRISRAIAYVLDSTGFLWARLYSGRQGANLPALGTVMNNYRVTTWNQGDDPTLAPPLRETSYQWRPLGREYDPRIAIIKDTPGPITVLELGMEVSV